MRDMLRQHLRNAPSLVDDPATVLCKQSFESVERDGGAQLGRLLARVMNDPDNALIIPTRSGLVFAFKEQLVGDPNPGDAQARIEGAPQPPELLDCEQCGELRTDLHVYNK